MGSRRVITGEAVALDLPAASLITRGGSLLIDVMAYWLLFGAMVLLGGYVVMFSMDPAMQAALSLSMMVLCLVIVPITVETLTRGRSLGKLIFGLRTVRDDGGAVRLRHSVIRGLAGFGEIYLTLGLAPLLTAMFTERSKRLGDVMAGTYAVRMRHPPVRPMMLPVPPAMAAWAQIADIGRIPQDQATRAARLLRTLQTGGKKVNMAALSAASDRIADQMLSHISPAPPTTSSIDFLSAVMAERRNREYQRLSRAAQRTGRLHQRLHTLPYA
ncbi:RDD family protein [Garicola koreensis]|uniref:Putative RDD family membrane protein YckC n=1 Tax=Garicola koreensis TaxID=1262554 RepID=A0A7W5TTC7_9MICC|nr:RDD family protein [Garicola koreensis]MBB3666489.1 putative RDD family membrane protein YckC [Garicola koreensis]